MISHSRSGQESRTREGNIHCYTHRISVMFTLQTVKLTRNVLVVKNPPDLGCHPCLSHGCNHLISCKLACRLAVLIIWHKLHVIQCKIWHTITCHSMQNLTQITRYSMQNLAHNYMSFNAIFGTNYMSFNAKFYTKNTQSSRATPDQWGWDVSMVPYASCIHNTIISRNKGFVLYEGHKFGEMIHHQLAKIMGSTYRPCRLIWDHLQYFSKVLTNGILCYAFIRESLCYSINCI